MARNRVIYNVEDVFIGPSDGVTNTIIANTHILQRLHRVQVCSYGITPQRIEIRELGRSNSAASPILEHPQVNIAFDYLIANISNELKMGLTVGWDISGQLQQTVTCPLSGMAHENRLSDRRSIYIATATEGVDSSPEYSLPASFTGLSGSFEDITNPLSPQFTVWYFENCYMTSYSQQMTVGDFIKGGARFIGDNVIVYGSGSGVPLSKIDIRSGVSVPSNQTFVFPKRFDDNQPSVLLPGDITLSMVGSPDNFTNLGYDFNDLKISYFGFDVSIDRTPVNFIGYRLPLDRVINFPTYANIEVEALVGDMRSGSLVGLLRADSNYDFNVKVRNPLRSPIAGQETAMVYQISGAKFLGYDIKSQIGQNKSASYKFRVEINPDHLRTGLFLSGITETPLVFRSYLMTESGEYFQWENGDIIRLEDVLVTPTTF